MSAAGAVITEFLASVGFKADEKSLKSSLAKVAAFGATVQMAAVGIYATLIKVASGEAEIAKKAELLGTTSDKLQELGYVAEQSGGSIDVVTKSIEALVTKNPRIKDGARALEVAGERMKRMSDAQRKAYADNMGIDRSLIPMLISDTGKLKDEFRAMYAVAGYDAKEAGKSSKEFMGEIGKLTTMVGLLAKSVSLAFIGKIRHDVANLRKVIMENFDKIKKVMEGVIKVILRIASVISAFAYRVITWVGALVSWYGKLDDSQKEVIVGIGLFLAAWKLLNAGFMGTPLGMIIMGLTGIVGLIDDYLTYMEDGESYFDWGPYAETIENARKTLSEVVDTVVNFVTEHKGLIKSLGKGLALILAFKKGVGIIQTLIGVFKTFNLVIKMNPIGFLLSLLVMAAVAIIDHWDEVKAFFVSAWEEMKARAQMVLNSIRAAVLAVINYFISRWEAVKQAAALAVEFIRACWEGLKQIAAAVADYFALQWEGLKEVIAAVANTFTAIWQTVKDWFFGLWANVTEAFPDFAAWASGAVDSIKGFFGRGIQWVKDKIKSLVDFLPDWVKRKMGLQVDGDDDGGEGGNVPGNNDDAEFERAINEALAASHSTRAPALTPSPALAANMAQNSQRSLEMNAKTEIHMHTSDPVAAGNRVADRQTQVNAETVRHMKGAVK